MSDQLFFSAILVIAILVAAVLAAILVVVLKDRKPAGRPAAPVQPSLAEIFADQILAGEVSKGLLEHYSSTRGKCKNCGGKAVVRWTPTSAEEHLQRPRLVEAIKNQELCGMCIFVLAKTVAGWKVVPVPVGKPSPAPAPQAVSADKSKDGKDEKKPRSLARYVAKLFVAVGFSIFTIFSITAALSALVPSEAVRSLGVLGMLYSFGAFTVAAVLGVIAIVLLRQLMR